MAGFKFIHAADLHIDSPMYGLERYENAPLERLRGATRRAFENLVQLAIDERVAFVLLAGDLFDDCWRDYNTGAFFVAQLVRLERAGIRVVLIHGNHDAAGEMTRRLKWPDNTTDLDADAPQTVRFAEWDVAIHGQSFKKRDVTANLVTRYPAASAGLFNIGLLHTALEGREGHASYAPCSLADLIARGYDYWALGHIHKREEVATQPFIVFPGNLQGRSVRETGPKGCTVVTVSNGKITEVRAEAVDVVRWEVVTFDASPHADPDAVIDALADVLGARAHNTNGRLLAVRATITGRTSASVMRADPERWRNELIARLLSVAPDQIWLEKVVLDLQPPAVQDERATDGHAALDRLLRQLAEAPQPRPAFVADLERRAGIETGRDPEDSVFAPANLARLRAEAVEVLRARLSGGRGEP